ncbi:MAG TPA: family 1 glycosylhydrolase [Candidatus Hydrogenedentes bacterium]|nr:family 1 glycosylhydrolase [Candidatus Hydrogenedentota bacterium]
MHHHAFVFTLILMTVAVSVMAQPSQETSQPIQGTWNFSDGAEFPGAKGAMTTEAKGIVHLTYDFRGGGNYVGAYCELSTPASIKTLTFDVKCPGDARFTVRVTDASGQCFQKSVNAPGGWQTAACDMNGWTGHWGGPNDGILHQPIHTVGVLLENSEFAKAQGEVLIRNAKIEIFDKTPEPGLPDTLSGEYVVTAFENNAGFGVSGPSTLKDGVWTIDFSAGAEAQLHHSLSMFGKPDEISLRVSGGQPGNRLKIRIDSHFQTFEREFGQLNGTEQVFAAPPPPEGWRLLGIDEKNVSYPLRIATLIAERGEGPAQPSAIRLHELRCKTNIPSSKAITLLARNEPGETAAEKRRLAFTCDAWNLLDHNVEGTLFIIVKDWEDQVLHMEQKPWTLPARGTKVECQTGAAIPSSLNYAEAEFRFEAAGLETASAQTAYVKPLETAGDPALKPESPWGMGVYLYRYGDSPDGYARMDRAAALAQAAGVKWSREEFSWASTEPQRGTFDFHYYDQVVDTAHRHGISVYGLLSYWSTWTNAYTEEGVNDFAVWARAVVHHFKDRIKHWEVYNEPNIFFWSGPKELYPVLVKKCYEAIKAEDPEAQVLAISTAGVDKKFIRQCLNAGAPFDILTIHPYRQHLAEESFIREMQSTAKLVGNRPVWITEMGWSTHVGNVDERKQALLLARAYLSAVASGAVQNISWYDFRNDGHDPFYFESNFGVVREDMTPKPAYRALATLCTTLAHGAPVTPHKSTDGIYALEMGGNWALWTSKSPRTILCKVKKVPVKVINMMGETLFQTEGKSTMKIPLRPGYPVFITGGQCHIKALKTSGPQHQADTIIRF